MKVFRMITAGLLALSMVAVSAEIRQSVVPVHAEEPDPALLREYAEIIVSHVNDARVDYQLSELALLPVMCDYAQVRAEELQLNFSHNRPINDADGNLITANIQLDKDGTLLMDDAGNFVPKNCFSVIKEDGFSYSVAAENIAAGNVKPVATFEQWMNSATHRANILDAEFTHIGIGYYYVPDSQYKYYWGMFLVRVTDSSGNPVVFDDQYIPQRDPGDADGSKEIDTTDVSRILQYSCQLNAGLPVRVTDAFLEAADVNADGNINAIDASIILNYIAASGVDPDARIEDFIW